MANHHKILVKAIYTAPEGGAAMTPIDSVVVKCGQGLTGDRYAEGKGFWQNIPKPSNVVRDVSFVHSSDIVESGFLESETRRNIVVSGKVYLPNLIGKIFFVGEVKFLGTDDCAPCRRPSDLCGKPNYVQAFSGKGGLRAQVLNNGVIKVGDKFRLEDLR